MTRQLFYDDPTLLEFAAHVDRVHREEGRIVVTLDQTAFYPGGGGQAADHGTLNGIAVEHVRKDGDEISHILAALDESQIVAGGEVRGRVDPSRRRDYMQQHTGQHIISGALLRVGGHDTVSVHLGAEHTTIEVNTASISADELASVEYEANAGVERALPVSSVWVTDAELSGYSLRRPPKVRGSIRLILIGDLDCVACGGVHVNNSVNVRLIRVVGSESIRGRTRISWMIGDRAIADYRMSSSVVQGLAEDLSVPPEKIDERMRQLEERSRGTTAKLKREQDRNCRLVAKTLVGEHEAQRGRRTITAEFVDEEKQFLRGVCDALSEQPGVSACLTNQIGDQLHWSILLARGSDVEYSELKDQLFPLIEAKGGGKAPVWQGVGLRLTGARSFLAAFERLTDRR